MPRWISRLAAMAGEAARAWQQVAGRAITRGLTQAITICAQATELISGVITNGAPGDPADDGRLLSRVRQAGQALDAAHELAYEAGDPSGAYCAACDESIGILASIGMDWAHRERQAGPAAGRLRNQIRDMGHPPVPAWRLRSWPAVASGRVVILQEP